MKKLLVILSCTAFLGPTCKAQSAQVSAVLQDYFQDGARSAATSIENAYQKAPDDPETVAYYALLQPNPDTEESAARKLTQKAPNDPWTLLAQAASSGFGAEANCDKAIELSHGNPSVLTLATLIMVKHTTHGFGVDPLKGFLSLHEKQFGASANSLMAQATALQRVAAIEHIQEHDQLIPIYQAALKLDPSNVAATLALATELRKTGIDKAYAFIKERATEYPNSYPIHSAYWKVATGMPNLDALQASLISDARRLIAASQPTTPQFYAAIDGLDDSDVALADAIRNEIKKDYPDTPLSSRVYLQLALQDTPDTTVEQNEQTKINALRAMLDRKIPLDADTSERVKDNLLYLLQRQENPDSAELYKLLQPTLPDFSWTVLDRLAKLKYRLPDLELIASKQVDSEWAEIRDLKKNQSDGAAFVDFWLGDRVHYWLDALGYIYLQEGKLNEADQTLQAAEDLGAHDAVCTVHLGELYEARGDYANAEKNYLAALDMRSLTGDSPAPDALRELYIRQHGGTQGLDAYMTPILAKQEQMRKEQVLAARDHSPKPMPKFDLAALSGGRLDSDSLRGKYVVINFWATWCGPCRAELPEYNAFYEKYRNDPRVAILAVATDKLDTPDSVISGYLRKNKFSFPVLRGPDYSESHHINSIPLTWFIDPDGKIEFSKLGGTKELIQEFDWRLDAMRRSQQAPPASKGSGK